MKAVDRSLESEASSIRKVLIHERTEQRLEKLLEQLRKQYVGELNPDFVDLVNVSSSGELQPVRRPGTLPISRRPDVGSPAPVPGASGLR